MNTYDPGKLKDIMDRNSDQSLDELERDVRSLGTGADEITVLIALKIFAAHEKIEKGDTEFDDIYS